MSPQNNAAIAALQKQLSPHIPEAATSYVAMLINRCHPVSITLTRDRLTKLGDYRHPFRGSEHKITVNANLNKYSFLITLLHELAHLTCWNKFKNNVAPHGAEWKRDFKWILEPVMLPIIFPPDVLHALERYLKNPAASSCTDDRLHKVLKRYDKPSDVPTQFVEDLPHQCTFQLENGLTLIKGPKLRKRFECKEVGTGKVYLVSPVAEVVVL